MCGFSHFSYGMRLLFSCLTVPAASSHCVDSVAVEALKELVGRKELEKFDLQGELTKLGLDTMFPVESWPPVLAMRERITYEKICIRVCICLRTSKHESPHRAS